MVNRINKVAAARIVGLICSRIPENICHGIVRCLYEPTKSTTTTSSNEVTKANRILEELEKAAKEGKGAAQLDGRMIDAASARMAENIVNINKLIQGK